MWASGQYGGVVGLHPRDIVYLSMMQTIAWGWYEGWDCDDSDMGVTLHAHCHPLHQAHHQGEAEEEELR